VNTSPQNLPDDHWLLDADALLKELTRIRELALQIPPTWNDQHGPIQTVIDAVWHIEERLKFLLQNRHGAHSATQQAFRAAAEPPSHRQTKPLDRQATARPANARRRN
jgi:hypothetical protein